MIRCSAGTAKVLGLKNIKVDANPTTAYFMVGEHCKFNCAFCAQARESGSRSNMLSRVVWPEYNQQEVLEGLENPEAKNVMKRVCFQVVQEGEALEDAKAIVKDLKSKGSNLPICLSAGPRTLKEIGEFLATGVDKVSLALDAATPEVFAQVKDGSWESRYRLLTEAVSAFPSRIGTHLIVGLGESEEEMVKLIQNLLDHGITVALFAFTPVRGTRMEKHSKPDLSHYRRIQAAYYLIRNNYLRAEDITYREGVITNFNIPEGLLRENLSTGEAFLTSGCPGCNRPYYNESPGEELYNYPRPLTAEEIERSVEQVLSGLDK